MLNIKQIDWAAKKTTISNLIKSQNICRILNWKTSQKLFTQFKSKSGFSNVYLWYFHQICRVQIMQQMVSIYIIYSIERESIENFFISLTVVIHDFKLIGIDFYQITLKLKMRENRWIHFKKKLRRKTIGKLWFGMHMRCLIWWFLLPLNH